MDNKLAELAHEVEAALTLSDDLTARVREALQGVVPDTRAGADFDSTDEILMLVHDCLPGWSIRIKGAATLPNGHWHCTLRRSDIRDNDPYLGLGNGPTLPHALLAALLAALAQAR